MNTTTQKSRTPDHARSGVQALPKTTINYKIRISLIEERVKLFNTYFNKTWRNQCQFQEVAR